jgi:hypothetical protein
MSDYPLSLQGTDSPLANYCVRKIEITTLFCDYPVLHRKLQDPDNGNL